MPVPNNPPSGQTQQLAANAIIGDVADSNAATVKIYAVMNNQPGSDMSFGTSFPCRGTALCSRK